MIFIMVILISIVSFLLAITIHEFCHALVATLLGDDTAKSMGRLTLNPFSHIDPFGLLFLILIGIGWAKPVPFNPNNFTHPRLYSVLVALAGPCANFVLALFFLYSLKYLPALVSYKVLPTLMEFSKVSIWINVMLGVFNLIPIPPLDGSRIISVCIPQSWLKAYAVFERFSLIFLIILLYVPVFQKGLLNAISAVIIFFERLVF